MVSKEHSSITPEYAQGALVEAFRRDLETPRSEEEQQTLYNNYLQHVRAEKERLLSRVTQTEKGMVFHPEDVIVGDAPFITPFDKLKGPYELIDEQLAAQALTERHYNLWILNHPSRIAALRSLIAKGYTPPVEKKIPVIDEATEKRIAIDFDDLGLIITGPPQDNTAEDSARTLLAEGPFTWVADNLVALPYILSSMPDVSNAFSVATHALSGGVGFVPFDSLWNKPANQLTVAKRAREILFNDPIIQNHPDKDFLLEHYQRLIGITVKASPNSIEDIKHFIREGFTTFRLYDARSKNKLEQTLEAAVKALQDPEFDGVRPKITFFVGQISSAEQALRIQKIMESAHNIGIAIVIGIGGGGICSTPKEAALHTANVNIGRQVLLQGFKKPVHFDGGVGDRLPVVFAMGGAGAFKSQALVGGCLEQPPGLWYIHLPGPLPYGILAKLFSGEAAWRNKFGGGKLDFLKRPLFVEGADKSVTLNMHALTMTANTYSLLQSLTTAMIFARVDSVSGFHQMKDPLIWTATEHAKERASVHHKGGA